MNILGFRHQQLAQMVNTESQEPPMGRLYICVLSKHDVAINHMMVALCFDAFHTRQHARGSMQQTIQAHVMPFHED